MTRFTPQWLQAGTYAASADRRLLGALWPAAASTGCAVSVQAGMTVNVAAGQVAVPSQNNTGSTLCSSDAVETVTLAAAPGAGTNRIDLVICQPRGNDLDGGANTDFLFTNVTGTPAASPTVPATPAGSVALAQILVPGGSASVSAGNITDVRPGGLALSGGASLPPYTGSGIGSYTAPDGEVWIAKNGVNAGAWRKARDVARARAWRAAAFNLTSTPGVLAFDTVERDPYGLYAAGTGLFTCPVAGLYTASQHYTFTTVASTNYDARVFRAGSQVYISGGWSSGATTGSAGRLLGVAENILCAAGDTLGCGPFSNASSTGAPGQSGCWVSFTYTGTG